MPWWWLVVWYGASKAFEMADAALWQASDALFAGHLLKHLTAAVAGFAIAHALRSRPWSK